MERKYTSIFKINGFPILPPLVTGRKRDEMSNYKKAALEIEKKIEDRKKDIASTYNCQKEESNRADESYNIDGSTDIQKDTSNAYIEKDDNVLCRLNDYYHNKNMPSTKVITDEFTQKEFSVVENGEIIEKQIESISLHEVPKTDPDTSVCLDECKPRLIRSNSYILENPSPLLLKHMEQNNKVSLIEQHYLQTKPHFSQPEVKKHKIEFQMSESVSSIKNKSKLSSKKTRQALSKSDKKIKSPYGSYPAKVKRRSFSKDVKNQQKSLEDIRLQQRKKMEELLKQQEHEQHLLREKFEKQEKNLLMMIRKDLQPERTSTPINLGRSEITEMEREKFFVDSTQSSLLSQIFTDLNSSITTDPDLYYTCEINMKSLGKSTYEYLENTQVLNREEEKAASVINSYVRGYLVRRLMRTEKIQKIIQVIKDTLMFILDLHHEKTTARTNNPATEKQMKRNLLNQLRSKCYMLHEIFFDYHTKERMEIIKKDRENIINKLKNKK